MQGTRAGGVEGARRILEAATLRRRMWRVEGVAADALEAVELFKMASSAATPDACDAAVGEALLAGEAKGDPTAAYRTLYGVRAHHAREPCARRIDELLDALDAFRPSADVLASIDQEARGAPGGSASAITPPAPPHGMVAQPKVGADAGEPAHINEIQRYGGKDAFRVVVVTTRPTLFEVGELPADAGHGPRLFVDIKNAGYSGRSSFPGEGIVERVRLGGQGSTVRVVLDLRAAATHRVFYLPEPFRLIIDVSVDGAADRARAAKGPRHVSRVVLDPGHGGHDPGATGPGGLREKDVVLDIAHRAAPLIARELGISTLLTRDADVFVPLDERVARANAFSSDLFVSIHCNSAESTAGRGVMTFVLDSSRDDLAMRVAARENSASAEAAVELANALSRVLDPENQARSAHFAGLLQRSAVSSLLPHYAEVADQGVKSAGFYVLAGARMPAVLFETSFISNPVEERRLDTGDYRQKLADAVVNAIRAFRDGL